MIFISIFFSLLYFIIKTYQKISKGCTTWFDGLDGMKLENNENFDKCFIVNPKKCWVNMLDGIFDVSRILGEDCNNFREGERKELLKYLSENYNNTYNFGYPITTNYSWLNQSHFDRFFNNVMADMVDIDNNSNKNSFINANQKPEVLLKFDKKTKMGKIEISINKNESLINERENLYNNIPKDSLPKYKNILFLYIDAISRVEFIRSMKHTQKFLSQFYNSNKNNTLTQNQFSFYQMMKYQAFIFFTQQNTNPMFFGESMFNSNGTSILKFMKSKGFITGHANNICTRQLYDIQDDYTENIYFENFDHELISLMCDPNYYNPENRFTPYMGPYSIRRRCLYGKDTFEYQYEYIKKFFEKYKNNRKFFRVAINLGHEGTGELLKYLDEGTYRFLNDLYTSGHLKDAALFILSDHGNQMTFIYNIIGSGDYDRERRLGTLFLIVPDKNNTIDEFYTGITTNQQSLVTPYDIHDTIVHICYGINKETYKKNKNKEEYANIPYTIDEGNSLFTPVNTKRNCKTYTNWFPKDDLCACF